MKLFIKILLKINHKFIKNHDEHEEHEKCKKHGMTIDLYHKFAILLEQQLLSPTSWEERLYAPTLQCIEEAKVTCK